MDTNKLKAQLAAMQEEINRTAEQYGLGGHLQQMMNGGEIHHLPVMPYGFAEQGMKSTQRPVYNNPATRSGDALQRASNYYTQSGSRQTPTGGTVSFTTEADLVRQMEMEKRANNSKLNQLSQTTSIVDAMKLMGDDASFSNRKKMAESAGIKNYSGTAAQNKELLKMYYHSVANKYNNNSVGAELTDDEISMLTGAPAMAYRTDNYQTTNSWQSAPNVTSQFVTEEDLANDQALDNMMQTLSQSPNFRYGGLAYVDGGEGDEELPNTGAMMMNDRAVASAMPDPNRTRTLDDIPARESSPATINMPAPSKIPMIDQNMTMIDYFRSHGFDPSYAARKEMFSTIMPGYKGTYEQNMELMKKIKSGDINLHDLKKKAGSKSTGEGTKKTTPAPKPAPAPAPSRTPSLEEMMAYRNKHGMATGAAEALYPEKYALFGNPFAAASAAVPAAAARTIVAPAARLLLPAAERAAIGTAERLALPVAERLALPAAERLALPTAERLALNVPRAGAQMEIPFANRVVNSFGQASRNPGFQSRISFPKGVPGNPGVQTEIQFGIPRVGEQLTIPFRQDGGMNYYAGGEIENDPHIMELYGFQGGGQIMEIPVAPYGYAEMGMMMGDDVSGKSKPTGAPTTPKMMTSQQLAGLATQFFSRDPSMQSPLPNFVGSYQLSDMDKTLMMEAMKQMKGGQGSSGAYPAITPQMIDQIRPMVEQNRLSDQPRGQRMGGMNYEDGGQMPMDVAVSRFKAAGRDKGLSGGELQMYVEKMKSKYNYQKGGVVKEQELGNYEVGMYGSGGIMYNGTKFPGYNKAVNTAPGDKFKKQMLLEKGGKIKLVKFGHR